MARQKKKIYYLIKKDALNAYRDQKTSEALAIKN